MVHQKQQLLPLVAFDAATKRNYHKSKITLQHWQQLFKVVPSASASNLILLFSFSVGTGAQKVTF